MIRPAGVGQMVGALLLKGLPAVSPPPPLLRHAAAASWLRYTQARLDYDAHEREVEKLLSAPLSDDSTTGGTWAIAVGRAENIN